MFRKIEISHKTIIFIAVFGLFLWFFYIIKDILFALFVAVLLTAILNPIVTKLTLWKIPRALAVFMTYVILFGIIAGAIIGIIPLFVEQTTNFISNFPALLQNVWTSGFINEQIISQITSQLGSVPNEVFKIGISVFSGFFAFASVAIFTFYMLLYKTKLDEQVGYIFGEANGQKFAKVVDNVEKSLGNWARGQLILMLAMGTLVFIGLTILGIPYALSLAIFTALLEIIPTIGVIIAGIPIVIIGLSVSPLMALACAALLFLAHQLEGYVLYPKVMEKSAGVNPIITLLALAIGYRLMGVAGALISVPVVLTLQIVIREYLVKR